MEKQEEKSEMRPGKQNDLKRSQASFREEQSTIISQKSPCSGNMDSKWEIPLENMKNRDEQVAEVADAH